ncbi:hypothetical protein C3F09_08050 [candidate division GN15 bacterium]|uniref:RimK-like ATPgrasp N-terminal domain-containing protein n=1 Tax=candidate division GN15 bacterium TaxID=2072418 RepID=A0A855X4K6_9BACT|nr:MAG: hypothetical protein C3F09_08050 [candidate division GN15 bacterium]
MPETPHSSPSEQPEQPPSVGGMSYGARTLVSLPTPQIRETRTRPQELVAYHSQEDCLLNLSGDYSYLSTGYYISQDLESGRSLIHPTCAEVMDAYVMPLFLEKAKRAGLPISDYYISNGYFEPPVIVDTINPFMSRHSVVLKAAAQERIAKSLTRNFTYAISCQDLPHRARVGHFHAVLGWSTTPKFRELAQAVWRVFGLPLAKVRVIACDDGRLLLSGLQPLPFARLTEREQLFVQKMVTWRT